MIALDEYVSETLACAEEPMTDHELAEAIADVAMAQGHFEGREFEDVVAELEPQINYYR